MFNTFKSKYKLYGIKGVIRQGFKAVIRKLFFFTWDGYYIMKKVIEPEGLLLDEFNYSKIKRLTLDDFLLGDKSYFSDSKLKVYKDFFNMPGLISYGIFENNVLIYSTWISYNYLFYSLKNLSELPFDSALLLDSWCHVDHRGRGLHKSFNNYRLHKIHENGKKNVLVIVRKDNIPALKTQTGAGFNIVKNYTLFTLGKKEIMFPKYIK